MAFRCIALLLAAVALALPVSAAHAADETRNDLVDPQHTNAVPDSPLQPPLRPRWQANLGYVNSPVLVTGGRVHYVAQPGTGQRLTALDASSGRELWSQPAGNGEVALAADGGRLFVLAQGGSDTVAVRALDPATGAVIWQREFSSSYGVSGQITADGGQLFFLTYSSSAGLHGVRQSDGADLWPAKSLSFGNESAPTLDASSVYVSLHDGHAYAFDRATGNERWNFYGGTGGGGVTTRLHGGRLYVGGTNVLDPGSGRVVGSWRTGRASFAGDGGVEFVDDDDTGGLRGFGPGYESTRWALPGGSDELIGGPLIAGSHAYVSRGDGNTLSAHRIGDGAIPWCTRLTPPPGSGSGGAGRSPQVAPVAAGAGLLLVRNGYGLAAFESGGAPSNCDPPPKAGGGIVPGTATRPPSLALKVGRTSLLLGARTNVTATLTGGRQTGGRRVVLDLDEWPFDGRFKPGASALTLGDGTVAFKLAPRRNVAVRARLVDDPNVVSAPAQEVYADFPFTSRRRGGGGPRPTITARVYAFPKARIRRKTVYAYLARGPRQAWRLVDRRRWQRLGKRSASVTLRYPRGRLTKRDAWLVCVRESKPDAFGRPNPIDARCGARRMPRGAS